MNLGEILIIAYFAYPFIRVILMKAISQEDNKELYTDLKNSTQYPILQFPQMIYRIIDILFPINHHLETIGSWGNKLYKWRNRHSDEYKKFISAIFILVVLVLVLIYYGDILCSFWVVLKSLGIGVPGSWLYLF